MYIKIVIPAMQYGKRTFIGGYVSSLRKKRGSGRAAKHDAWYHYAYLYLRAALSSEGWKGEVIDEAGYKVTVIPWHQTKAHMDGTNVLKGIEDILVGKVKGVGTFFLKDDKMLEGHYHMARYDKKNPRLIVIIERAD